MLDATAEQHESKQGKETTGMRNYLKVAEQYRRGEIDDQTLDAMAQQWTGYSANMIRKIASQLDDRYLEAKTTKRRS